jgi:hypothetical protein
MFGRSGALSRHAEADRECCADLGLIAAIEAYERVGGHEDLERGPCIAEELPGLPDWVADIAHDPREAVDDEPANQCQRYRDGEASHFVELTPEES